MTKTRKTTSPAAPKPEAKPDPSPAHPERKATIWKAETDGGSMMGYLITEKDNINLPITWIEEEDCEFDEMEEAQRVAGNLAEEPEAAGRYLRAKDFREFGRPDSTRQTPGILYGMWCRPIEDLQSDEPLNVPVMQPNPFCPVRFAKWKKLLEAVPERVTVSLSADTLRKLRWLCVEHEETLDEALRTSIEAWAENAPSFDPDNGEGREKAGKKSPPQAKPSRR
jgi:hypothetical protein